MEGYLNFREGKRATLIMPLITSSASRLKKSKELLREWKALCVCPTVSSNNKNVRTAEIKKELQKSRNRPEAMAKLFIQGPLRKLIWKYIHISNVCSVYYQKLGHMNANPTECSEIQ